MEAAASEPMTDEQYIGTGPYKFVERQADRFTLFNRFDDYVGVDSQPSGYAGSKAAYLDEIEFIPVPDEAARVAGLQSGEYHYLEEIIPDQIEVLQDDPGVNIEILPPRSYGMIIMNTAGGLMTDVRRCGRRCRRRSRSMPSGQATHGEGYFEPGPGIMLPQTIWALGCLGGALQPERPREGAPAAGGSRLRRHADPPPLHPGGPRRLQRRRRGPAAARSRLGSPSSWR